MIKTFIASLILLFVVATAHAQKATAIFSFETKDASQFGYDAWSKGANVTALYRFTPRWEGTISGEMSDQQKHYIGVGKQIGGSLGARFYVSDSFFVTAGATVGVDRNPQYVKWAARGFIGAGVKVRGVVATLTAFAPPGTLTVDANQVKGLNLLFEYFRPIAGPIGAYASAQASLASFNQTGGDLSKRFTGASYQLRSGFYLSF